jgi:hypothetical protein
MSRSTGYILGMSKPLKRLDVWLRVVFERRYGPLESWPFTHWLVARRQRESLAYRSWGSKWPRRVRRRLLLSGRALDHGLLVIFERFFGPLPGWRLSKWLIARRERKDGVDPSVGRGQGPA